MKYPKLRELLDLNEMPKLQLILPDDVEEGIKVPIQQALDQDLFRDIPSAKLSSGYQMAVATIDKGVQFFHYL